MLLCFQVKINFVFRDLWFKKMQGKGKINKEVMFT